jgi:hypothetical protein
MRTQQDNERAGSTRDPRRGAYGAETCQAGFVWRDAFPGDHTRVTPETRAGAVDDNREGPVRIKR